MTPRAAAYCLTEEGLVLEAYLDSASPPVWTWAGGVTNASGHRVYPRYKDKPQTIRRSLEVTLWLMENTYLPPVLKAFANIDLTEHQLAAALSFHWNTGRIADAHWVRMWCDGEKDALCGASLVDNWSGNGVLFGRRQRERALFFDAIWPLSLRVPVYQVAKPSYAPVKAKLVDVMYILEAIMGAGE